MFREPDPHFESLGGQPVALRPLRVGMIGIGTVGAGTFRVLARNQAEIAARAGRGIEVVTVAARNLARAAAIVGEGVALTDDPLQVATHPEVDVLVEVAGGTGPARDWVLAAITHGKHVVTANKALLAEHGEAIFGAARQHGMAVAYEGAVAVSIPIIKALREGLTANRIGWVAGIVNGTTNFILGKMRDEGLDFATALAQAQALGYAEANPAFDIDGIDAAHKLALLAGNAFGMRVDFADVQVEGITALQRLDVACAEQLGYRIKLLAVARRRDEGVELRVQPALLPASHLLAQVNGSLNGILVHGDASGMTLYCGAGAGSEQTASAVIADLVDITRLHTADPLNRVPHLAFQPDAMSDAAVLPMSEVVTSYYLRLRVADQAGVLAKVTGILANAGISIDAVLQREADEVGGEGATSTDLIILTHETREGTMNDVIAQMQGLPSVLAPITRIRKEELN
jgi:homoserine dehydrogenase